jgi:secreted trypsin-like serine protease
LHVKKIRKHPRRAGPGRLTEVDRRSIEIQSVENTLGINDTSAVSLDQVVGANLVQGVDTKNWLNKHLFAAGWGSLDANSHVASMMGNRVPIRLQQIDECFARYPDFMIMPKETVICGLGADFKSDTCLGDSGGPLYTDSGHSQYLVGVVSFGVGCGTRKEIGNSLFVETPGVYSRLYAYNDFINAYVDGVARIVAEETNSG